MFRGREFEIFDEPEPYTTEGLVEEFEPPRPDARHRPAASGGRLGDPWQVGLWARRVAAIATLAATVTAAALLLTGRGDNERRSPVAGREERAPRAKAHAGVQNAPPARVLPSRARPEPRDRRPERRRARRRGGVAGATPPVAPSHAAPLAAPPPPASPPLPAVAPPPASPPLPAATSPGPARPAPGPARAPVGELPAPAAPRSTFEP
jgi:hypothetical protein